MTAGAVASRELGELNREFAFAQLTASGRFGSLYVVQEVDMNRGWKREAGEAAFTPTSTFAAAQLRLTEWFAVQAGADNRRNVRLYRDYVSPETEFDDAFRQGVWGGANVSLFKLRAGGDARISRGGFAGDAAYYTGTLGIDPFTPLRLETRGRSTRFRTDRATGWLHSWSAATAPFDVVRIQVNGGLRTQQSTLPAAIGTTLASAAPLPDSRWLGLSVDLSLGRSWYVLASGTRDGAGVDLTTQLYASLVYRF
jgi:hypothetical protein